MTQVRRRRRLYLAFHGISYDLIRDSLICYFDCYLVNDLISFALEFFVGNDILLFVNCNIFRIISCSYFTSHDVMSHVMYVCNGYHGMNDLCEHYDTFTESLTAEL